MGKEFPFIVTDNPLSTPIVDVNLRLGLALVLTLSES